MAGIPLAGRSCPSARNVPCRVDTAVVSDTALTGPFSYSQTYPSDCCWRWQPVRPARMAMLKSTFFIDFLDNPNGNNSSHTNKSECCRNNGQLPADPLHAPSLYRKSGWHSPSKLRETIMSRRAVCCGLGVVGPESQVGRFSVAFRLRTNSAVLAAGLGRQRDTRC